jgi:glycosyltransferase involved in cell wall biosynthesis
LNSNSHITVFLESLGGGGAEQAMVTLMNAFVDKGYTVDLVLCKSGGTLQRQLSDSVKVINLHAKNLYFCLPRLMVFLKSRKPRVMLTTLDLASIIALIARRMTSVQTRIIIRVANTVSVQKRNWIKKKIEYILLSCIYPWADKIIAVSQSVADDLVKYINLQPEHVDYIYNPVITPRMMTMANEPLAHPWFKPGQPPVILGVGRLTRQKNFDKLLLALAQIREVRSSRLLILGEGEQRENLQSWTSRLKLTDEVSMPGFVDNPFPYMKNAAVFVLSSSWEGLPAVLIQALACGCPVVSTDCPSGPNEILDQGRYGRLVPVGDATALAQAILDTLSNPLLKPDNIWLEKFSLAQVVDQYLNILVHQE